MSGNDKKLIDSSSKNLLRQGTFLTVASLLVRFMGIIYRVPLTNLLPEDGLGTYSDAYQIYVVFLMISSNCVPTVLSKLISEKVAIGDKKGFKKIFRVACFFFASIGILMALLMFFGSDFIANTLYHNPDLSLVIKVFSPTVLIVNIMSLFRGYFQGFNKMIPSSVSQFAEGLIHAVFTVIFSLCFVNFGIVYAVVGAVSATGLAAVVGLLVVLIAYIWYQKTTINSMDDTDLSKESGKTIIKNITALLIPIFIANVVYELKSVVDSVIFTNLMILVVGESDKAVTAMRGFYSGKFSVFCHLPISFGGSISAVLVPSMAADFATGNTEDLENKIKTTIKTVLLICIPASIGLMILGKPIIKAFFPASPRGGELFWVGALAVAFYAVSDVCAGILQGTSKQWIAMVDTLISFLVSISCITILVLLRFGVYSLPLTFMVFSFTRMLLFQFSVKKHCGIRFSLTRFFIKPLLSAFGMAFGSLLVYLSAFCILGSNMLALLMALIAAVVIYFFIIINLSYIANEDLKNIPFGKYLTYFYIH